MAIKFLNTVAVDTDVLYVDASNDRVGVGTTSPTRALDVSKSGSTILANFKNTGGTSSFISLGNTSSTADQIRLGSNGTALTLSTNYAERMRIDSSGNVGIGTTNPATKLHISDATTPEVRIQDTTNNRYLSLYQNNSNSYIQTSLNSPLVFSTHGANERMRITTAGNVGIGTTSPSHKLTINASNDTTALGIDFPSAHFDFSANSTSGYTSNFRINDVGMDIGHDSTARSLNLQTGNQDRLTILGNGNVGIGTTSPSARLEVQGGTTLSAVAFSGPTVKIGDYSGIGNTRIFSNGSYIGYSTANSYHDFSNTGSSQMRITSTGNVGVGTTSPTSRLHITDSAPVLKLQSDVASASNTISFTNSAGAQEGSLIYNTGSNTFRLANATGNSRLNLDNYAAAFSVGTSNLNQSGVVLSGTTLNLISNFSTALTCDFAGRVGIGTTNPGAKLDVLGFVNLGSLHTNYAGATYSVNMGFQNYNNGFAAIATGQGTLADASQSFSMGYRSKATGVASLAGGNVNTSTALPSESAGDASLAFGNGVKTNTNADFSQAFGRGTATGGGSTTANQAMAMGFACTAYADNSFSGGNNSNAFGEASFAFGEGATASKGDGNIALGIGVTTPTTGTAAYGDGQVTVGKYNVFSTGIAHNFAVGTGSSDLTRKTDFCVTSAGNVGIGDTTPSYKLDVNGTGRFTNTLYYSSLVQQSQADTKKDIRLVGKENSTIPIKEYKYKTGDNDKVRYGVMAEDVESTYPELVETDADGIKGVKYIDLLVRKIAELETEKRTLVNWRHYHGNTSYNTLYDAGMTTAFPYAYGSIPAPYDMYFTSVTLVNNPYSSYNKGPEGDAATFQAYVNGKLAYEVRDIRYGQNPYESITADFGQNVRLRRGESLQIRFQANGTWRYCNSTIILTEI